MRQEYCFVCEMKGGKSGQEKKLQAGRLTLKRGKSFSVFVQQMFLTTKEKLFMRPGKKLITGLLPTFLCVLAMLIVACGGTNNSTSTSHTKAAANKQVFVSGVEEGNADLY